LTVAIHADIRAHAAVADYFWPHHAETPQSDTVVVVGLGAEQTPAQRCIEGPGEAITLYDAPDGDVADYNTGRVWQVGDCRVVLNPHTATYFTIRSDRIAVRNPRLDAGVVDLCRVIKQLAATHFEARGRRVLHTAAVEYDGRAVLFVGPKGSGKTTLMCAALDAGAKFVTNDRVFLDATTAPWRVRGWSDPMRLVNPRGGKKTLVPLHSYFGGEGTRVCRDEVEVGLVIFPRVTEESRDVLVTPVGSDLACELINGQILPRRQRWLGIEPEDAARGMCSPSCGFFTVRARYTDAELAVACVLGELCEPDDVDTPIGAGR
jgi:hypothetical protein